MTEHDPGALALASLQMLTELMRQMAKNNLIDDKDLQDMLGRMVKNNNDSGRQDVNNVLIGLLAGTKPKG